MGVELGFLGRADDERSEVDGVETIGFSLVLISWRT